MILSHRHRFIFLKTRKTAGTSIEIALSKFLGDDDIITPIDGQDEEIRRSLGYRGPQNFAPPFSPQTITVPRHPDLMGMGFHNHIQARAVRNRVGLQVWGSYYKFCFERNPWDRVASLYHHHYGEEPRVTMLQNIASGAPLLLREAGWFQYTINGNIAVDRVGRYESLEKDLEEIRLHLKLPEPLSLPGAKTGRRPKPGYRHLFDERERQAVAQMFAPEIQAFGYRF